MTLPPPMSWLWAGWKAFSYVLGMVMSKIILTLLWIVGFGIYGIVLKVMNLFSIKKPKESYWVDAAEDYPDSMRYQF